MEWWDRIRHCSASDIAFHFNYHRPSQLDCSRRVDRCWKSSNSMNANGHEVQANTFEKNNQINNITTQNKLKNAKQIRKINTQSKYDFFKISGKRPKLRRTKKAFFVWTQEESNKIASNHTIHDIIPRASKIRENTYTPIGICTHELRVVFGRFCWAQTLFWFNRFSKNLQRFWCDLIGIVARMIKYSANKGQLENPPQKRPYVNEPYEYSKRINILFNKCTYINGSL